MIDIAWSFVGLIAVAGLLTAIGTVRADRRDRERQR